MNEHDPFIKRLREIKPAAENAARIKPLIDSLGDGDWNGLSEIAEAKRLFGEGSVLLREGRYPEASERFERAEFLANRLGSFFREADSCIARFRELEADPFVQDNRILASVAENEASLREMLRTGRSLDESDQAIQLVDAELDRVDNGTRVWKALRKCKNDIDNPLLASFFKRIEKKVANAVLHPGTDDSRSRIAFNFAVFDDGQVKELLIELLKRYERLSNAMRSGPFAGLQLSVNPYADFKTVLSCRTSAEAKHSMFSSFETIDELKKRLDLFSGLLETKNRMSLLVESLKPLPDGFFSTTLQPFYNMVDDDELRKKTWTEESLVSWIDSAADACESAKEDLSTMLNDRAEAVRNLLTEYAGGAFAECESSIETALRNSVENVRRWEKLASPFLPFRFEWNFQEDDCRDERFNAENMTEYSTPDGCIKHELASRKMIARAVDHPDVACLLGIWYRECDPEQSRSWFEKSAKAGSLCGMNDYGVCLCRLEQYGEAQKWFDKAARAGNKCAVSNARIVRLLVP